MPRTYDVIDADGHVLEPVDIWEKYIEPKFRERAPRIVVDTDGKERLDVEGQVLGSQKGFGVIGAIGARQGDVPEETMQYIDGRKGGFDPHARIPDMDLDGIDAAFLYPSVGLFAGAIKDPAFAAASAAPTTAGLPITASPTPTACSASPCCRCSRSTRRSRRCVSRARSSVSAAASCGPIPTTTASCT